MSNHIACKNVVGMKGRTSPIDGDGGLSLAVGMFVGVMCVCEGISKAFDVRTRSSSLKSYTHFYIYSGNRMQLARPETLEDGEGSCERSLAFTLLLLEEPHPPSYPAVLT